MLVASRYNVLLNTMVDQLPVWVPVPLQAPEQTIEQPQPQPEAEPQPEPELQPESQPETLQEPESYLGWMPFANEDLQDEYYKGKPPYPFPFNRLFPAMHYKVNQKVLTWRGEFMYDHLVEAWNHEVDYSSLVWPPLNQTPEKGQKWHFQTMPFDIQFEVAKLVSYQDVIHLKKTNRYLQHNLDPRKLLPVSEIYDFVSERDKDANKQPRTTWACQSCWKFLPRTKFTRRALKQDSERFCFDCAGDMRWYPHLSAVYNGRLKYYFCHNCGNYGTQSERCQGKKVHNTGASEDEMNEARAKCFKKPTRQLTYLETLPTHIMKNVAKFLSFKDLLRLSVVSRALNEQIDHDWAPIHDRFRCIKKQWEMEREKGLNTIPKLPCFTCLEWRTRTRFTKAQIKSAQAYPENAFKFRCQSCVHDQHTPSKDPARAEYQRRQMCDICNCVKLDGTTCGGCLELYFNGEIDRETMFPSEKKDENREQLRETDGIFLFGNDNDDDGDENRGEEEKQAPSELQWWDVLGLAQG